MGNLMNSFNKASKVFSTNFDTQDYFESVNAVSTMSVLVNSIVNRDTPLIFLLGEPGVGKTYMLEILKKQLSENKKILFSSEPFSTPESFLLFLLEDDSYTQNISELKKLVIQKYEGSDNLVILDEAQLSSQVVLEFIRTLSDLNVFTFLLSMHKSDGEVVLKKSHFASRDHKRVIMGVLTKNEVRVYIEKQLLQHSLSELNEMFGSKQVKLYQNLSEGNFRVLKQLLKHTFLIMSYAKENALTKYITPSSCVITMAAIDLGIIDA
jgi:predicted AAA+ superfamily ATPase